MWIFLKNLDNKIKTVKGTATEFGCTILLKGEIDIISDGEKNQTQLNWKSWNVCGRYWRCFSRISWRINCQWGMMYLKLHFWDLTSMDAAGDLAKKILWVQFFSKLIY